MAVRAGSTTVPPRPQAAVALLVEDGRRPACARAGGAADASRGGVPTSARRYRSHSHGRTPTFVGRHRNRRPAAAARRVASVVATARGRSIHCHRCGGSSVSVTAASDRRQRHGGRRRRRRRRKPPPPPLGAQDGHGRRIHHAQRGGEGGCAQNGSGGGGEDAVSSTCVSTASPALSGLTKAWRRTRPGASWKSLVASPRPPTPPLTSPRVTAA